jgi:hypothetical protein
LLREDAGHGCGAEEDPDEESAFAFLRHFTVECTLHCCPTAVSQI